MVGWFIEFLVEKYPSWHGFCFSSCCMLKRVKKSQAILALLDSFQELHLEWQAWVIIVFIPNFMKSSAVYEASYAQFVLLETLIWPSMRFDISLHNFKKPLVDTFSPQIERKNVLKNI